MGGVERRRVCRSSSCLHWNSSAARKPVGDAALALRRNNGRSPPS